MSQDVTLFITDRNGVKHEVLAPTDMNMNVMELIRSYELAEEGTVGICGGYLAAFRHDDPIPAL